MKHGKFREERLLSGVSARMAEIFTPKVNQRISEFLNLLNDWQLSNNLTGAVEAPNSWQRHVFDSLQLVALAPAAAKWLDLGTGSGFPGIIIAAALADTRNISVDCVESDTRKCAFLTRVAGLINLPVTVHLRRIEDIKPYDLGAIEAVTARGLTSLNKLIRLTTPFTSRGAIGIFPIGRKGVYKVPQLSPSCRIEWFASNTEPDSVIARVFDLTDLQS